MLDEKKKTRVAKCTFKCVKRDHVFQQACGQSVRQLDSKSLNGALPYKALPEARDPQKQSFMWYVA